ncbi:hypothetical protein CEXT_464091 [Caerostris extrusa]|uniref:Uncharacterized protein n=1 Tax=Caerostris extrusa TaxID=172846 RepID=A0AAV4UPR5_CAEEX|nr:hypothetical protein CEXT_464091 [Caerostris extrusa]
MVEQIYSAGYSILNQLFQEQSRKTAAPAAYQTSVLGKERVRGHEKVFFRIPLCCEGILGGNACCNRNGSQARLKMDFFDMQYLCILQQ